MRSLVEFNRNVKTCQRITKVFISLNHVPILNLSRRNTSMWAGGEWGWCWCTTTTTSTATTATSNTTTTSTATSTTIHSGKWGRARTRHWSCFGKLLVPALLKLPLLGSNCAYLITNYDLLQCKSTIIWICIKNTFLWFGQIFLHISQICYHSLTYQIDIYELISVCS